MAIETVTSACLPPAGPETLTALPQFLTKERRDLALAANCDTLTVTKAAIRALRELGPEATDQETVLRALLLRAVDLIGVTYAALGDESAKTEELQRELAGDVL